MFGLGGAYAYHAANAADAMWGYRTPELERLGKVAARLDDVLHWVPARGGAFLRVAVSPRPRQALAAWWRDAGLTASPNAGQTMATVAGQLDVLLEKLEHYVLHAQGRESAPCDIAAARKLVARAMLVGSPEGGWVHWGATTQNIAQTGDVLGLRMAHRMLTDLVCDVLIALADLGERTADFVMAGRTHWQHAVPITFGFKVAAWSDVMPRHLERLRQIQPRLFTSMAGGAAGTFATLGDIGPVVQERRTGLEKRRSAPDCCPDQPSRHSERTSC